MTYREIYNSALCMVCEDGDVGDTADYEERACYLLATAVRECAVTDKSYRLAHGMETVSIPGTAYVDLADTCPLTDALTPALTYYLSAMLVIDENEDMSEAFFSRYTDSLASLTASLTAQITPITDRYAAL